MKKIYVFFIILFLSRTLYAEYRVYKLKVTNIKTKKFYFLVSTLDHFQYLDYYHLKPFEVISLEKSWMCYGRTDYFKPLCPDPTGNAAKKKNL